MRLSCTVLMSMITISASARAEVVSYTARSTWEAIVSGFSTISFLGFPDGTPIADQYAAQGLHFLGFNQIFGPTIGYQNDLWGLFGPNGVRFTFDNPQNWIAVDYPGAVAFRLYHDGELMYSSPFFQPGGLGNFAGLVSDTPFDEVYILKPIPSQTSIFIDDLHWGSAVPAPAGLTLLLFTAVHLRRRRS